MFVRDASCFGGSLLKNSNAKGPRPLHVRSALHVVLRSRLAKGPHSLLRNGHRNKVNAIIERQARRFGVRLFRYANSGNHIHILLKPPSREAFRSFIRAVSGLIARVVLKAQRGAAKGTKFWDQRPFTRIVSWGRHFNACRRYIELNILEALGFDGVIWETERQNLRLRV